jgi:hypothetical protein
VATDSWRGLDKTTYSRAYTRATTVLVRRYHTEYTGLVRAFKRMKPVGSPDRWAYSMAEKELRSAHNGVWLLLIEEECHAVRTTLAQTLTV